MKEKQSLDKRIYDNDFVLLSDLKQALHDLKEEIEEGIIIDDFMVSKKRIFELLTKHFGEGLVK